MGDRLQMDKIKNKSLRRMLFQYSSFLIFFMMACFIVSVELNEFFQRYNFYKLEGDSGVFLNFFVLTVIMILCLNCFYSRKISSEILWLTKGVKELQEENLDVDLGHSKISEIEETLRAIDKLRSELKASLEKQWKMEEHKVNCILALGHDMKTPIAIIKGNLELMSETGLNDIQREYNDSNLHNVNRMQRYTEELILAFKSSREEALVKKNQNFDSFFGKLSENYYLLGKKRKRVLKMEMGSCGEYCFDEILLERAINNVVINAFENTKDNDSIKITLEKTGAIYLIIEDSGEGFSKELLEYGVEAFVRADKSRSKRAGELHLGLGLYQAKKIAEFHGGELEISNSIELGGARVEIRLI